MYSPSTTLKRIRSPLLLLSTQMRPIEWVRFYLLLTINSISYTNNDDKPNLCVHLHVFECRTMVITCKWYEWTFHCVYCTVALARNVIGAILKEQTLLLLNSNKNTLSLDRNNIYVFLNWSLSWGYSTIFSLKSNEVWLIRVFFYGLWIYLAWLRYCDRQWCGFKSEFYWFSAIIQQILFQPCRSIETF